MKIVYIAHKISGNVNINIERVMRILKKYHTDDIAPIAPYIVALNYLDDSDPNERGKGMSINKEFFTRGMIDELWLCGDTISNGMREEIRLAEENHIPVINKICNAQSKFKKCTRRNKLYYKLPCSVCGEEIKMGEVYYHKNTTVNYHEVCKYPESTAPERRD